MPQPLTQTNLQLPFAHRKLAGKVRDVYVVHEQVLLLVATDRVSAFDHILGRGIPHKGEVLTQTAAYFLRHVPPQVKTHLISVPDPQAMLVAKAQPYPVEVIVRGHLSGHAWRLYQAGQRGICGNPLPEGLKEHDPLPEPIITPTTKAAPGMGHDEDVTEAEVTKSGLVAPDEWMQIRAQALALFDWGQKHARERGLILADTKYEFGYRDFDVLLIDEVHTPDSSRYLLADGFEARQAQGQPQPQLSKEFLREWLMQQGFRGQEGATPPTLTDEVVAEASRRYIQVYEQLTGTPFAPRTDEDPHAALAANAIAALDRLGVPREG